MSIFYLKFIVGKAGSYIFSDLLQYFRKFGSYKLSSLLAALLTYILLLLIVFTLYFLLLLSSRFYSYFITYLFTIIYKTDYKISIFWQYKFLSLFASYMLYTKKSQKLMFKLEILLCFNISATEQNFFVKNIAFIFHYLIIWSFL